MHTFHVVFYKVLQFLVRIWFGISGAYRCTGKDPKASPVLVLTNHNTNWDFLYFGASFSRHMYYVASEHIFRTGFISKAIKFLASPVARKKGASSAETVSEIKSRLAKGYNVCMMADGNRSFSGETGYISPGTAALVKECGAGLVTYRLHGGYFVNPRWSHSTRKGRIWGEIVAYYTEERLAEMSPDEVYDTICRDLYVNAYADQETKNYSYKAKAPAETLETALFSCPECGAFNCLRSSGDKLVCESCGTELTFSDKGYFSSTDGEDTKYTDILSWSEWQKKHLKEYINKLGPDGLIRTDEGARLFLVHPKEGKVLLLEGNIALYKDRLVFNGADGAKKAFSAKNIKSLAVILVNTMLFTAEDGYYEVKLPQRASALHYMISYYYINGKEYKR